ncbi:MAG: ferrous iron transport protein B [Oscillospiraceae bacterium]
MDNAVKEKTVNVGFIGNPNCGKTTLFNAYTGAKLKVANWPGVTVEKKEGAFRYHNHDYKLVDLPGIYSLTSYTMEERLSRQYILEDDVDVIVDVADASSLERNLYLTLQLIELGKPVVLALNMMDIVEERGMEIDMHRLPEMLGIPVVPVSARKRKGLDVLMHAVAHHKNKPTDATEHSHASDNPLHQQHVVVYSDDIEKKIAMISERINLKYGNIPNIRWYAIKLLEYDDDVMEKYPVDISDIAAKSYEKEIINQKYDFIEEIIEEVLVNKTEKALLTDKIDSVLTHRIWGMPVFFAIMALVFFLTFTVGDFLADGLGVCLEWFQNTVSLFLESINAGDTAHSLIVDGIISGVGGILMFLPNIFILFLALAFLEDSGYMSRVAYVMDGLMGKLGLSGRAFIPMLLGFGCTVPAVMASRTLENHNDKIKTILVTPFMSCSARLPIYVLFSGMFFGKYKMLAAYSMYIIGLIMAILISLIFSKISKNKNDMNSLLIELPEYKTPNARSVAIYVWDKVKDYLTKAGTTIFVASIILWVLMNYGMSGFTEDVSQSFAGLIGKSIVPLLKPVGLGFWQISIALISGIFAKEVVVSSTSVLFGVANVNSEAGMAQLASQLSDIGFTALNAYSLMVFCLLYVPCIASIAAIKSETKSWKYAIFSIIFQTAVAWVVSFAVYQIGGIIWQA